MDFDLNDEQKRLQAAAREFAQGVLEPVAAQLDRSGDQALLLAGLKKLAGLGLMGLPVRREYGGAEAGLVALALVVTEIARACASTATVLALNNMVSEVIQSAGSEAQRRAHLPRLCSGEYPAGSFALTEPEAGSDAGSLATSAVLEGEEWVLNGCKRFITSAAFAGVFTIWAVTDPAAPKGRGISLFLAEAGTPGLIVGPSIPKMGQTAATASEVAFEDCRLPKSALMGTLNDGFRAAMHGLGVGRIGVASLALGIGLAAMDTATRYAGKRLQFGQKISDFQATQWKIADAYTELEAARLLVLQAAWGAEQGRSIVRESAMAKLYAAEAANRACYAALQMLGGNGYTRDYPLERHARDVRVTSIYEGTSEVQRLVIAREVLKSFA